MATIAAAAGVDGRAAHAAAAMPEIRLSETNRVPRCVTPDRLMAFLKRRNGRLLPQFRDIAGHYRHHGEVWQVRWDYAFFQMAIETNFLTYRAPSGRMGDVDPKQNNFAGIGTTGGGVPGDSFPDVSTGVLGQIQHLVVYSGEMIDNPVAQRTQLKQQHILAKSRELNRPVRFSDLARRWAVDPKYARSIAWVADQFMREECSGRQAPRETEVLPWQEPHRARPAPRAEKADPSAVRTVWRRGDAKADDTARVAKAKPLAPAIPAKAPRRESVTAVDVADAPVAAAVEQAADATEPVDDGFAMFTPPAALAEARMDKAREPLTAAKSPAAVATVEPKVAAAATAAPSPMGPPSPPPKDVAVAPVATAEAIPGADKPANFLPPSGLGVKPGRCVVETATFGGNTTVLVKSPTGADVHYIAVSVLDGFEDSMTESFLAARPGGGERLGVFPSKDAALAQARNFCPE